METDKPLHKGWYVALAVIGALCALTIAFGLMLVFTNGHPEAVFGGKAKEPKSFAESSKLAGATETIDVNGIIHGTTEAGVRYDIRGRGEPSDEPGRVSFAAVGDVLATDMNFGILDAYGGVEGDGVYSFEPYYQEMGPVLAGFDISLINQETAMAGDQDGFAYSGYPSFNTPDASLDAIGGAGLDVVNFNSNHTWDMGEEGMLRSHAVFDRFPQILRIGSYESKADRSTVHMVSRGGVNIAFLSFCYGTNTFGDDPASHPNDYYSCIIDKKAIAADVRRAQAVADAVVVYMHWGTEEMVDPDEVQLEYEQYLADLGVDLVVGSHAHLCQTVRYYTGQGGKRVPVVFGLSDFISGWTLTDTIFSGLFTCDFVVQEQGVAVENLQWHPLIEWSDGGDVYVRMLELMSDDAIQENTRTEDVADDVAYLQGLLDSLDMECAVTWPVNRDAHRPA
ncbi:MAG: CapA family protein [Eggerthellaceae bacterium]|nr:CapA family protein [Eggerthellaceae bacterium]